MQKGFVIGTAGAFFNAVKTRIICIIALAFPGFVRQVRGGVDYWRGNVSGGGFNSEYCSASQGVLFAESSAFNGLAVGLPGYAKDGGGVAVGREFAAHQVNKTFHNHAPVRKPRLRVLLVGKNVVLRRDGALCQRVVDGFEQVESVSFMPR